jgi:Na+-translocating ferredoxin:NAD+ oxidoreductase RNF subunit RnfB
MAVGAVSAIGFLCAVILAIASKIMHVPVDERTEEIRAVLPGANCGACGYAGCDGYAAALTSEKGAATNLCIPGGDGTSQEISNILGVAFADVIEMVAVVKCAGNNAVTSDKMAYDGIQSCAAAKLFFGGPASCQFGCLGLGDCVRACIYGAISVTDGVARVDKRLCTGCGMCANSCPKYVIDMVPAVSQTAVLCSNTDKGALTRTVCKTGCIGCNKCVKDCPSQAFVVKNNLALVDNDKCTGCGVCAAGCPVKCIQFVGRGSGCA